MKSIFAGVLGLLAMTGTVRADEGMWLLPLLEQNNIDKMRREGLKLSADDIYSVNKNSLKDAVVIFGRGCTGEIVSGQGLLLTNYHCGFGNIQQHSTVETDYIKNGFWAGNMEEEIPTPGLTATFIRRIEDVSARIIPELNDAMTEHERNERIAEIVKSIIEDIQEQDEKLTVSVRDFFGGNQYLLFVSEVYKDVRLVGAPPYAVGKFGGDTDNWMWPRHTCDFAVFRVYSDSLGRPADYAAENIPYRTENHLKISLAGTQAGDFAMVMGFPGNTRRYMTTYELDQLLEQDNPNRIFIRGERQRILLEDMQESDQVRIQYAAKYARSSNYWKNSIGMNRGLKRLKVREKRHELEEEFFRWAAGIPDSPYAEALPLIRKAIEGQRPVQHVIQFISEALLSSVELLQLSAIGRSLESMLIERQGVLTEQQVEEVLSGLDDLFKDYNEPTDRKVARRMFSLFYDHIGEKDRPNFYETMLEWEFGGDFDNFTDYVYDRSIFTSREKLETFLQAPSTEVLINDPGLRIFRSVLAKLDEKRKETGPYTDLSGKGHRLWIAGLMEMDQERVFYPDANSTIRLSYGHVLPYEPADAVFFDYYTTLSGVIEKEDPLNTRDFTVTDRLKELYYAKDFGAYGYNGDIRTAFITDNDITGGNSGSPVLNGNGELIGLAFDGNWEAMSGDIAFEHRLQRTICVDIRYVLFIIDKYAGATRLIEEMTILR